jgi:hypothetical protein
MREPKYGKHTLLVKAPRDDVLERKIIPNYFFYDHDDAAEHIHISLVFIEGGHYCPVFSLIDSRLKKPNALLQRFVLADIDFAGLRLSCSVPKMPKWDICVPGARYQRVLPVHQVTHSEKCSSR